jgi:hypothetical protein
LLVSVTPRAATVTVQKSSGPGRSGSGPSRGDPDSPRKWGTRRGRRRRFRQHLRVLWIAGTRAAVLPSHRSKVKRVPRGRTLGRKAFVGGLVGAFLVSFVGALVGTLVGILVGYYIGARVGDVEMLSPGLALFVGDLVGLGALKREQRQQEARRGPRLPL